jgi:serine/threonine-protein kinase
VAYDTARPGGGRRLYLRALSGVDAKVVSETSVGSWFFSPDSEWLGFFEAGKMKKVPVRGGPSQTIADASSARGASWGEDGFIVFAPSSRVALSRVSANGGAVQTLTTLDESRGETSHRYPTLLPGGRAVVYRAEGSTYADGAVVVYSLDTKQQRVLVADGGSQPRYSPTGHLLYLQAGSLMAARFDIDRLELTGPPTELIEGAQTFGLSNTGSLVYEVVGERARSSLVWVDRRGIVAPLPLPSGSYQHPRVSPDGRRIVFSILNGADRNLWTYDIGRDVLKKLTIAGSNLWPVWTTDGSRVVYASNKVGTAWDIFQRSADGSGTEESLLTKPGTQVPRAMSPNGEWVAFTQDEAAGQNLWLLPMKEKSVPRPFTNTKASETEPAFSPDGRWIAYMTNESSGRDEVYVRPVDGAGKWPISTDGGSDPVWNPSGHELFYRDGVKLYAVEVSIGSRFVAGKRRLLFEGPYALGATGGQNYDISPDGKRFVMMNPERSVAAPWQLNIVTNWFEELKRQVPAAH